MEYLIVAVIATAVFSYRFDNYLLKKRFKNLHSSKISRQISKNDLLNKVGLALKSPAKKDKNS